jgi:hypothetical protein
MARAWQSQSSLYPPEAWQNLHPTSPRNAGHRRPAVDTVYEDETYQAQPHDDVRPRGRPTKSSLVPPDAWYNLHPTSPRPNGAAGYDSRDDGVLYGTRLESDRKVLLSPKARYDPNTTRRFSYTPFTQHEEPLPEIKTRIELARLQPAPGAKHLTGPKLYSLIFVLCLVAFLVLLNAGIVATVRLRVARCFGRRRGLC